MSPHDEFEVHLRIWSNNNAETWARDYLVKDQRLSAEDAQAVIEAESGKSYIPDWKSEIITDG